jgi:hypothetical protein
MIIRFDHVEVTVRDIPATIVCVVTPSIVCDDVVARVITQAPLFFITYVCHANPTAVGNVAVNVPDVQLIV